MGRWGSLSKTWSLRRGAPRGLGAAAGSTLESSVHGCGLLHPDLQNLIGFLCCCIHSRRAFPARRPPERSATALARRTDRRLTGSNSKISRNGPGRLAPRAGGLSVARQVHGPHFGPLDLASHKTDLFVDSHARGSPVIARQLGPAGRGGAAGANCRAAARRRAPPRPAGGGASPRRVPRAAALPRHRPPRALPWQPHRGVGHAGRHDAGGWALPGPFRDPPAHGTASRPKPQPGPPVWMDRSCPWLCACLVQVSSSTRGPPHTSAEHAAVPNPTPSRKLPKAKNKPPNNCQTTVPHLPNNRPTTAKQPPNNRPTTAPQPPNNRQDADAEVVVTVRALTYASSELTCRTKLYPVLGCV